MPVHMSRRLKPACLGLPALIRTDKTATAEMTATTGASSRDALLALPDGEKYA